MAIIVQKYGGSSVQSMDGIKQIAEKIIARKNKGHKMVIVVSALGDNTQSLVDDAHSITATPDNHELEIIKAAGEMVSSSLLAIVLKSLGHDCVSYTAMQLNSNSSVSRGMASFPGLDEKIINRALNQNKVVILSGFQGIDKLSDTASIGKDAADITAIVISARLNGICEIYTDAEGIYTIDPKLYKRPKKLDVISYEEILELISLGADIINSRAIELAEKYNVPVYVAHSGKDEKGTYIKEVEFVDNKPITGIAISDSDAIITLEGVPFVSNTLADTFESIAEQKISVDMISQTTPIEGKVYISFTIPKKDIDACKTILNNILPGIKINIDEEITKFSVVGMGMKSASGVASRLFKLLSINNIQIKMVTTSEIRITCAIEHKDKLKAVQIVAREFGL
ncbi:aspartokinase [Oxobacter pfennigii]|uniref:Aspartokinase n=1 Tax=Oxobacter pfennigii TaxID=36849 RepID=A0A0P8X0A5_9CLOT|nr:aspartate kinase [Oxobacter pfennigii]KPU44182.1 aspartokinase [Oxobacter pfennigii]